MGERGDDVLRAKPGYAAEKYGRKARLIGDRVEYGQAVPVERDAAVRLDPGKGVLLADRDQHVIAGEMDVGLAGWREDAAAVPVARSRDLLERHARQLAVVVNEGLGDVAVQDRNAFGDRALLLPGGRLSTRAHGSQ